jgi:hypothetical protein
VSRYFLGCVFFIVLAACECSAETAFTLKDAIHKALETTYAKNSKLMVGVVKLDRDIEERIYAPDYSVVGSGVSDQTEKGNPFIPDTEIYRLQLGVDKTFKTGTTVSVQGDISSQKQHFASFDDVEYVETVLRVGVEQDIWRNAFGVSDRRQLKQWDMKRDIQIADITDLLEETVYQSTVIFWNLALSERQVDVAKKAMDNAETLYEHEVKRSQIGVSEPRIVEAVKANWLDRQVVYDEAVARYEAVKDRFLTILDLKVMPPISDNADLLAGIISTETFKYDWEVQSASLRRYQSALLLKDTKDIDIELAMDKAKPKLVVFARTLFNGIEDKLGDSVQEFSRLGHMGVEGGVKLSFLGGNQSLYDVKRAHLEKAIQENNIEMLEEDSQLELKEASRQVSLLKSVMDNRSRIAELLSRKFTEDQRQYTYGRIGIDEYIDSQDRHLATQLAAINAKYQYLQAVCRYFRVDNTLLSKIAFLKEKN